MQLGCADLAQEVAYLLVVYLEVGCSYEKILAHGGGDSVEDVEERVRYDTKLVPRLLIYRLRSLHSVTLAGTGLTVREDSAVVSLEYALSESGSGEMQLFG